MNDPVILQETVDGVSLITLNRPRKLNGVTPELSYALADALESALTDKEVRVIALTGAGKAFCAGADLGSSSSKFVEDQLDDFGSAGRIIFAARVTGDKPVITGVNGLAMGVGVSFALLGDIRIASSAAKFSPGYARVATSPDGGLTWTLPQAIGREQAMRFLFEGKTIDAKDAQTLGLVGQVIPENEFKDSFIAYCKSIAENSPFALRQTKRLMTKAELSHDTASLIQDELRYVYRGLKSDDAKTAIKALFKHQL